MKRKAGFLYVLISGVLWGCLGLFARALNALGFTTWQIVAARSFVSVVAFAIYALLRDGRAFRIRLRDIWYFIGTGIISIVLFNWCYFTSIQYCALSVSAILLYTSPIFVMLFSAWFFRERITAPKVIAMLLALSGCVLVSGITKGLDTISEIGVITGIASGIFYALYSIFARVALKRYRALTINLYTFLFSSCTALPVAGIPGTISRMAMPNALWIVIASGLVCTVAPFFLYTKGLETLDNGRASIVVTIEPMVAAVISVTVFHEPLDGVAVVGIVLILAAIVLLTDVVQKKLWPDNRNETAHRE